MSNLKHQTDEQLIVTLRAEVTARQAKEAAIESLKSEQRQLERTIGKYHGEINNSYMRTKWATYYLVGGEEPWG